jgi:phosphoribosylformylglycinamidine synthase I
MSAMKIGITRFPGTNCDYDVFEMVRELGHKPHWLWFEDKFQTDDFDSVIIPGGFSYGDYLRCGALAARSPVMDGVRTMAEMGKPILGICNGFQILCEAGLLPGVLTRNENQKFIDRWVELEVKNTNRFFARDLKAGQKIKLPIAHGEGRVFIPEDQKAKLKSSQIWLTYTENPNGSMNDIAGVSNEAGNVVGLMPHPERALHAWMGGAEGRCFL